MSQIQSTPTLLEGSKATNFKYELVGKPLSTKQVDEINNISGYSRVKKRVEAINGSSCMFDFVKVQDQMFSNNLVLIDSVLPQVLASMLVKFYIGNLSKTSELLDCIEEDNILEFNATTNHRYYSYKVSHLYSSLALGMTAMEAWSGYCDDPSIRIQSGDALIKSTRLEIVKSTAYGFGMIYSENKKYYMDLNLQIGRNQ